MLFERNADGLLIEVADTEDRRKGRHVSRAIFEADILFTPEEEAARDAEEAKAEQKREQRTRDDAATSARRAAALAKFAQLGITDEDLKDAIA